MTNDDQSTRHFYLSSLTAKLGITSSGGTCTVYYRHIRWIYFYCTTAEAKLYLIDQFWQTLR